MPRRVRLQNAALTDGSVEGGGDYTTLSKYGLYSVE
jgi:hypothetical protein